MIEVKNTLNGKLNASIVKEYPELEEITITPTLDGQELEPSKYGYSKVKIQAIPATDISIEPTTQEQVKTGIFKNVTVEAVQGETLDVTPTEQSQAKTGIFTQVNINPIQVEEITTDLDFSSVDAIELKAQEGAYIKKATINKDSNLSPENIKSGVTVCGVSGDVADTSDADATSRDIAAGKTAYVNNEKVIGTMEVSNYNSTLSVENLTSFRIIQTLKEIDFSEIDTSKMTNFASAFNGCKNLEKIIGDIDCLKANNMRQMFYGCSALKTVNIKNTGASTDMGSIFHSCSSLVDVPLLDTKSLENNQYAGTLQLAFYGCNSLSDESLNNILLMCANATKITYNKTLNYIGLTASQATRCQNLSNWQVFLDAGWQTGY